jgi:NAD(P) transhydrogenase subunit alpha
MTLIFVPRETTADETRISVVPDTVKRITQAGMQVSVEDGAGLGASFRNESFTAAGASVEADAGRGYASADVVMKLHPPTAEEAARLREGAHLIGFLYPHQNLDAVRRLAERKVTAFAMDLVPRISRAQKMDALSSQSNIAGYKAVILAADHLGKLFPLMMTAAGTITPARVVIIGAGVAGLQAIATARRLGAVVEVSDIRPAVKEQVESLGGRFIDVGPMEDAEDRGGYAKEASKEFQRRQEEALRQRLREADVCITTALIPGRPAPKLVSAAMVEEMREGAVLVDLAADQGGNCELTQPGGVVTAHGVRIVGLRNVAALVPTHASEMYARNVLAFLLHLWKKDRLVVDPEEEITRGCMVIHEGKVVHEPTARLLAEGGTS